MVKIARVTDGLPLAEGLDDGRDLSGVLQAAGEAIIQEPVQRPERIIKNVRRDWTVYIPLAFQYLEDLKNEFEQVNGAQIETAARPYAFIKFDTFIQKTEKLYQDTRTQRNIAKLNDELLKYTRLRLETFGRFLALGSSWTALIRKWAPIAAVLGVVFLLFWVKSNRFYALPLIMGTQG